jgi:hypothetical protein
MGPDLYKMSDDELYNRLGMIQSRLAWASNSSHGAKLVEQLQFMFDEVTQILRDRLERMMFEQNVLSKPAVVNIDGPQEKKTVEDPNSRAKTKSDIITRLRRSTAPTNMKDA